MSIKNIVKTIKASESTISMILGIVVVVVVGILLFNYFKGTSIKSGEVSEGTKTEGQEEEQKGFVSTTLPTTYTVQPGDDLWKISQKFYNSGYNWVDISKENKLTNPNIILVGQKLLIPNVNPKQPAVVQTSQTGSPITGSSYIVQKGDSLWNISVRAYQDGFKWTGIVKANNIQNPNIIHPGNVLTIPR